MPIVSKKGMETKMARDREGISAVVTTFLEGCRAMTGVNVPDYEK